MSGYASRSAARMSASTAEVEVFDRCSVSVSGPAGDGTHEKELVVERLVRWAVSAAGCSQEIFQVVEVFVSAGSLFVDLEMS